MVTLDDGLSAFEEVTGASLRFSGVQTELRRLVPELEIAEVSPEAARWAAKVLARAARKYPPSSFDCVQFGTLILVAEIDDGERGEGGFALRREGLIVLATYDWQSERSEYFLEREFHHEVFHLVEDRVDAFAELDQQWRRLNSDVEYGPEAEVFWRSEDGLLDPVDGIPGFLSQYGTVSVLEDKAELFSFMMWSPKHLESRVGGDPALRDKMEILLKRLRAWCPAFAFFAINVPH